MADLSPCHLKLALPTDQRDFATGQPFLKHVALRNWLWTLDWEMD